MPLPLERVLRPRVALSELDSPLVVVGARIDEDCVFRERHQVVLERLVLAELVEVSLERDFFPSAFPNGFIEISDVM